MFVLSICPSPGNNMFSDLYYRTLHATMFLFSLQGSIPWSFNPKTRQLFIRNYFKVWNRVAAIVMLITAVYASVRTIQAKQRDIQQFLIAVGMSFFSIWESLGMLLCSFYAEEVKAFVNGMINFSIRYQRKSKSKRLFFTF